MPRARRAAPGSRSRGSWSARARARVRRRGCRRWPGARSVRAISARARRTSREASAASARGAGSAWDVLVLAHRGAAASPHGSAPSVTSSTIASQRSIRPRSRGSPSGTPHGTSTSWRTSWLAGDAEPRSRRVLASGRGVGSSSPTPRSASSVPSARARSGARRLAVALPSGPARSRGAGSARPVAATVRRDLAAAESPYDSRRRSPAGVERACHPAAGGGTGGPPRPRQARVARRRFGRRPRSRPLQRLLGRVLDLIVCETGGSDWAKSITVGTTRPISVASCSGPPGRAGPSPRRPPRPPRASSTRRGGGTASARGAEDALRRDGAAERARRPRGRTPRGPLKHRAPGRPRRGGADRASSLHSPAIAVDHAGRVRMPPSGRDPVVGGCRPRGSPARRSPRRRERRGAGAHRGGAGVRGLAGEVGSGSARRRDVPLTAESLVRPLSRRTGPCSMCSSK